MKDEGRVTGVGVQDDTPRTGDFMLKVEGSGGELLSRGVIRLHLPP